MEGSDQKILPGDSLEKIFAESLERIQKFYKYPVSYISFLYVSDLLQKNLDKPLPEKPLTFMLKDALEEPDYQKYKKLGDASLMVGGLIPESVNVSEDHFITMGVTGYSNAGALFKPFKKLYSNLAKDFPYLLNILRDFRYDIEVQSPEQWETLYEVTEKTGSSYLKHKLGLDNVIFVDFKRKQSF